MEKVEFKSNINAPREKVWQVLWEDETYRDWTRFFAEGSHAVSDWEEGSKIIFLESKGNGMYSIIEKKIPNEQMSFKHLGSIKDGKERPFDGEMKSWGDSVEDYRLVEKDGGTQLIVRTEVIEQMREFFMEIFPKALARVKELSEKN